MLEIGERTDTHLTPSKLAAFYKAVGGDYDCECYAKANSESWAASTNAHLCNTNPVCVNIALFVDMPHSSISYMWQVTGCQHTLQPTGNDFDPPSIPALTFRGFSRWESLEILLGPEEHVPFLQCAVKKWNLKHPETGEDFPVDLPAACFPAEADAEVDRWHKTCADKLWTAASNDEAATPKATPAPEQPPPKFTYVHVREPSSSASTPRPRQNDGDYFGRPMSYAHIPRRYASQRKAERSPDRPRRDSPPLDDRGRRKSFSDYASAQPDADPPPPRGYSPTYLDPNMKRPGNGRRHSHPRHEMSESSGDEPVGDPREKRRRHPNSPPPPSVRRFVRNSGNPSQSQGSSNGSGSLRPPRSDGRPDETKRRSGPSPLGSLRDKFTETVSSILPNGLTSSDRPRPGSRQNSGTEPIRSRRSREQVRPSRLSRSYSDLDTDDSDDPAMTESDRRRRRMREGRERERDRDRERYQRGRDRDPDRAWEEDKDTGLRREKSYLRRPEAQRRTSSHADIDRKRDPPEWDSRDRDRERDRDRVRDDRRKWERRTSPDEVLPSPAAAMAARRMHPEAAYC